MEGFISILTEMVSPEFIGNAFNLVGGSFGYLTMICSGLVSIISFGMSIFSSANKKIKLVKVSLVFALLAILMLALRSLLSLFLTGCHFGSEVSGGLSSTSKR